MSHFTLDQVPSQKGKIAIVTGANIGLGYETTIGLAQKAIKVIMACRNQAKADKAKKEIEAKVPGAELEVMILDLSKLKSVRAFAETFLSQYEQLDLLINNAGIMIPPFSLTEDGFESQMGVNHFGHFLLTGLLLPVLEKTADSRVVSVSSKAHESGKINFDDLQSKKSYSRIGAYAQSKLANLLFTYELQRRLEKAGSHLMAVAAHPGGSPTNLGQHIPWWAKPMMPIFLIFMSHPPKQAALPTLQAALAEDVKAGDYFGPTGFRGMKGKPGKVTSTPASHDKAVAAKLWEVSEDLTGIEYL